MSLHDNFVTHAVSHPEWEKIRTELCGSSDDSDGDLLRVNLAGGVAILTPTKVEAILDTSYTFTELCWYIHQGPGYCVDAPPKYQTYFDRLGLRGDISYYQGLV